MSHPIFAIPSRRVSLGLAAAAVVAWLALGAAPVAQACPFCQATQATFGEELLRSDVVVVAEQATTVEIPDAGTEGNPTRQVKLSDLKKAKFKIDQYLVGQERLAGVTEVDVLFFGEKPAGTKFLIFGVDGAKSDPALNTGPIGKPDPLKRSKGMLTPSDVVWSSPLPMTERSLDYILQLAKLPEDRRARLNFFKQYLEDGEQMLATDAYNEFAISDYALIRSMKDDLPREKFLAWIQDPEVTPSHRRQYLTLLGVCGEPEDLPLLETMIRNTKTDEKARKSLDSLIACYLMLRGAEGLPLVEESFLKNPKAEYTDTYNAIMAVRFHGEQADVIPRPRLAQALRGLLDRPQLADLVIPDLARWEDWTVIDRLTELFKTSDEENRWIRAPVMNYLRACPLPEAQARLEELAKIDPETYRRSLVYGALKPSPKPGTESAPDGSAPGTSPPANSAPVTNPSAAGEAKTAPAPAANAAPATKPAG